MRELDAALDAYWQRLDRDGTQLGAADIEALDRLLNLPDPELYGYLLGRGVPADPAIAELVEKIRAARA